MLSSAIRKYDTKKYNFQEAIRTIFNNFSLSLEAIHILQSSTEQVTFANDTKTMFHSTFYKSDHYSSIRELYYQFVKDNIFKLFPDEISLVVQKDPGFRVCTPNNTALGKKDGEEDDIIGLHCDADYNHPPEEVNFIIAITEMWGTNSVYIESQPGKGDFTDLNLRPDEFHMFWGNKCRHYNKLNVSGQSRISMDFRVIPMSKYNATYVEQSVHGKRSLVIGDYFIKMDKEITLVKKYWDERPCNIRHSNKEVGKREYFEEVTRRKYLVEPHILDFASFDKYKGKSVLEIGCGIGTAAQSFIEAGADYTGVDLSEKSIEVAKKRFEVFGLNGKVRVANIEELAQVDESKLYDLVYSFGVLHHTPETELAVDNIWKLLKPGGEFKLMMYAKHSWKFFEIKDGLDQYEAQSGVPIAKVYTHDEIRALLHKFKDIDITQTHIFPYKVDEYKQYKYVKKDYFAAMPDELFQCLERNLGWHLCITCRK